MKKMWVKTLKVQRFQKRQNQKSQKKSRWHLIICILMKQSNKKMSSRALFCLGEMKILK